MVEKTTCGHDPSVRLRGAQQGRAAGACTWRAVAAMPRETRVLYFSSDELVSAITYLAERTDALNISGRITSATPMNGETVSVLASVADQDDVTVQESMLAAALILHCRRVKVPMAKSATKKLRVRGGRLEMIMTMGIESAKAGVARRAAARADGRNDEPADDESLLAALGKKIENTDDTARDALADWISELGESNAIAPWRQNGDPWRALMGEIALDSLPAQTMRGAWRTYQTRWQTAKAFLADKRRKSALEAVDRGAALRPLTAAAKSIATGGDMAEALKKAALDWPKSRFDLVLSCAGADGRQSDHPSVRRVAERVLDFNCRDSAPTGASLVTWFTAGSAGGAVYAGAWEISQQYCHTTMVHCTQCPLRAGCASALDADTRLDKEHPLFRAGE